MNLRQTSLRWKERVNMKWIYDKGLIIRQVITWILLLLLWLSIISVFFILASPLVALISLLITGGIFSIQYFFSDRLVLKLMNARIIEEHENPRLYRMVRDLSTEAGIPMPKIAITHSPIPNAFATGRNRSHSVVAVTTGIIPLLANDEMKAVLAHEISHIKNYDMATMTIASFLAAIASSLMMTQVFSIFRRRKQGLASIVIGLFILMIVATLYAITLFLTRLLSRYRELAADRGSALITKNPDAMIRALEKISGGVSHTLSTTNTHIVGSNNLFYIIPAARKTSFFGLFSTHPSLKRRVKNLLKIKQEMNR